MLLIHVSPFCDDREDDFSDTAGPLLSGQSSGIFAVPMSFDSLPATNVESAQNNDNITKKFYTNKNFTNLCLYHSSLRKDH